MLSEGSPDPHAHGAVWDPGSRNLQLGTAGRPAPDVPPLRWAHGAVAGTPAPKAPGQGVQAGLPSRTTNLPLWDAPSRSESQPLQLNGFLHVAPSAPPLHVSGIFGQATT